MAKVLSKKMSSKELESDKDPAMAKFEDQVKKALS